MRFTWAKQSGRAANPPLDGSITSTPHPDPAATQVEDEAEKNVMGLEPVRSTLNEDSIAYPHGIKLALLILSVFVSMFLVALDRLIISTAIPQITDDFKAVNDIGWYGSAYLLTNCAFQLTFGKLYTFYSVKTCFLTSVALFEIGSAICGAAPSSIAFIVGRAIAGLGSAGIFSGAITIIVYAVPLHKRPVYQGLFGAVFGVASVIGPLLGGAFTSSRATWRWCFYINLPFGGIAMLCIFFLLHVPDRETTHLPTKAKLSQLDAAGLVSLLPGVVCLLLALQWGGIEYPWSDGRVIALLVLAGVLLVIFVAVQIRLPKTATVPPRIFVQRSIMAGSFATLCLGASMMIEVYFLPIWFQAIKGVSAVDSGIRLLPLVLPMVVASIISGGLIARLGYYTPFMLFGVVLLCIGAGLLTTFQVDTEQARWIGYQVVYGFGMGNTFQAPNLAAQTVLPMIDVPIGTSIMFFSQLLGGAIFISVGQNVLNSKLLQLLEHVPGFDASFLLKSGATTLTNLPDSIRPTVLVAYNEALREVFRVGLIVVCLTIFGAGAMEWKSVKKNKNKKPRDSEAGSGTTTTATDADTGRAQGVGGSHVQSQEADVVDEEPRSRDKGAADTNSEDTKVELKPGPPVRAASDSPTETEKTRD